MKLTSPNFLDTKIIRFARNCVQSHCILHMNIWISSYQYFPILIVTCIFVRHIYLKNNITVGQFECDDFKSILGCKWLCSTTRDAGACCGQHCFKERTLQITIFFVIYYMIVFIQCLISFNQNIQSWYIIFVK